MNHIELFAGCGGLSLGLESAGFNLLFANELSPMAAETFAYNHLDSDLSSGELGKVYWVNSKYPRSDYQKRLRENPFEVEGEKNYFSDLDEVSSSDLERSLLVGSIRDLNAKLDDVSSGLIAKMRESFGSNGVDLISGGPPCQSFSLAGMRDHTNDRNKLPWEFAKFVGKISPKMAMLENVSGILRPFNIDGQKHYAWFEVCKAFAEVGYVPLCLHVNAKYVGAAQNRPRFVMLAFREDIFYKLYSIQNDNLLIKHIQASEKFYTAIKNGEEVEIGAIKYFDVDKNDEIFSHKIFSRLKTIKNEPLVSVKNAIHDLAYESSRKSQYVRHINEVFISHHRKKSGKPDNHEPRANSPKVRARFRIYQLLTGVDRSVSSEYIKYMQTSGASGISEYALDQLVGSWIVTTSGELIESATREQILTLLSCLYTKKQTQRALISESPAPAALSIPDDACHYVQSPEHLRTLTVREMARIQSFPDWFSFRSKVTTGGQMRRYEVPQYTQVGNAVPPLLGLALGDVCRDLLSLIERNDQRCYDEALKVSENDSVMNM